MSLQIKPQTILAVLEKAMQYDPVEEYCGEFISKHEEVGNTLSHLATQMARLTVKDEYDMPSLMAQATVISSAMFMTYEMANAAVEAKELEELFDA